MKNKSVIQSLRKQMSNQIHYDLRPYVSPMTTEGMKSMSPSKQMTRNQINTNTIKPEGKATGIASLGPATRLEKYVGDCISSLCISPICNINSFDNKKEFLPSFFAKTNFFNSSSSNTPPITPAFSDTESNINTTNDFLNLTFSNQK